MAKDVKVEVKPTEPKPTHRYFCDACTGIAFVTSIIVPGESRTCEVCGKVMVTKKENFIKIKK